MWIIHMLTKYVGLHRYRHLLYMVERVIFFSVYLVLAYKR